MNDISSLIPHYDVDEIARRYEELGIPGLYSPEAARLLLSTLREIAKGEPVTEERVREIAPAAGLSPDAAVQRLANVAERNADGDIIGLMGLTQNAGFDISFTVNGVGLHTWCALDSLFLPLLLNSEAEVEAASAVRGQPVRFTIGPDGITSQDPASATVSLVIPSATTRQGIKKVEDIWTAFCHQIRFFESAEEAEEWAWNKQDLELAQLTLAETADLAGRAWGELGSYAWT